MRARIFKEFPLIVRSAAEGSGVCDCEYFSITLHNAMLSTSGAQALLTSGADVISGLAGAVHEAGRVRDMREYPFWARGTKYIEIMRLTAPRKILRDSPTRRGTPKI